MTYAIFETARLSHVAARPAIGTAVETVIPPANFDLAAAEIIAWAGYEPTPLHDLKGLAQDLGIGAVLYKDEGPRFGIGSFKALGAAYAALRVLQREISKVVGHEIPLAEIRSGTWAKEAAAITLVSATDGNHGRSLAWGCQRFGVPCRIYIHAEVSKGREQAIRALGAKVIRTSGDYDASVAQARDEAAEHGWFVVSDTSWPGYSEPPRDVMAGYGVMVEEVNDVLTTAPTHVFLQGGVGGLAAAVAARLRQTWGDQAPSVVVVEPELAACLIESERQGRATTIAIETETVMAGLSCGEPSGLAWSVLTEVADDYLTIPDTLVGPSMRLLARPSAGDAPIEAGESGVAGLACLIAAARQPELRRALRLDEHSRVLLIGSEGITDAEIYAEIMGQDDAV